jgi:hypothetical protein
VVADDEPAIAVFDADRRPLAGELVTLDETPLPTAHAERKAAKPDLESLCLLPDGALFTLGSGATERRERGWLFRPGERAGEEVSLGDLYAALSGLTERRTLDPAAVRSIHRYELGEVEGVALSFSDLCPLPDGRLLFCAVAEAGESTYLDGECVGAALGVLDPGGVRALHQLSEPHKIEGVSLAGGAELLLVADGDDPGEAAPLLAASPAL